MTTENAQATGLKTEPISGAGAQAPAKKGKTKKKLKAPKGKSFKEGDSILFHVKHLHGQHGIVTADAGDGQYVVRGNEEGIEGQLFQFSADQLEPATAEHLAQHNSTRLDWDYPED